MFFSASLSGQNEVSATGAPAVGDPNGSAKGLVEVEGSQVTFAFSWTGITAPTMGHIHEGAAGADGGIEVPLFESAMPETTDAAAGSVTVDDPTLVHAITSNPTGYYLNLHTSEFPDGAVRGQLHLVKHNVTLLDLLGTLPYQAFMDGGQEVPAGAPDGHGVALIRASGSKVHYAFVWDGISEPLMGHIHVGAAGVSGPIKVPLFATAVPANIFAIAGGVTGIDNKLTAEIRNNPSGFYTNLHTVEFPAGAVRGQLFRAAHL